MSLPDLVARLRLDSSQFRREIDGVESHATSRFTSIGNKMQDVGKKASLLLTAPVLGAGSAAFKMAGDYEESLSKMNTVFGNSGGEISSWAKGAATSMGLSRKEAIDAAGSFGNMFTQLGIGQEKASGLSRGMIQLATDLGSFHNADITDVIEAQSSAFRGEYDALQRYIPTINAATVEQRALEMTGKKATKELTAQEKALAVEKLMMEGAGAATGDFARTQGSAANQQRILTAKVKDGAAVLGKELLPIGQKVIGFATTLAEKFGNLSPKVQNMILVGAGLLAVLGPLITVIGSLSAVIGFLAANPIVLVIAAIAGLVAGAVLAYQRIESFRETVDRVARFLMDKVIPAVTAFAQAMIAQLSKAVDWVKRIWPDISEAIRHVMTVVKTIIETVIGAVKAMWRAWGDDLFAIVTRVFGSIRETVNNVLQIVAGIIRTVLAIINGDWGKAWDAIKSVLSAVWDQIKNVISTAASVLKSIVAGIVSSFAEILRPLGNFLHTWIVEPFEGVVSFVRGLPGKIRSAAGGMWDGIKDAFRSAINFIIRGWNNLEFKVPGFKIGPVGFGGFTLGVPNIPLMEHGGRVLAGMPYIVGEKRPELFVPDVSGRIIPSVPSGGSPIEVSSSIYVAGSIADEESFRRILDQRDRELLSTLRAGYR